ncbi:DinB family protein [Pseudalkalibacillus salsuginis]|uniref:DinB family protein n=1 Tax=Pseudalkalibacillus salsuginis TaxID=2910972 RepID=UPI001F1FCB78|nr:DinB family protein [Pseudalkalibacillus salsuginis]MCF6409481.1 DinB family protein [Pseudalkalibacillus salsuginis]
MDPIVGMFYSAGKENFQRLNAIASGMSQQEVDYHGPEGKFNSTGQLIKHLSYVDLLWVYRIKGEPLPHALEEKYGPMLDRNNQLPKIKDVPLQELLNDYKKVFNMFKSECAQLTERDLDRIVVYEDGKKATIRWGIWHMADHSRYHQAHINQLRKWYRECVDKSTLGINER